MSLSKFPTTVQNSIRQIFPIPTYPPHLLAPLPKQLFSLSPPYIISHTLQNLSSNVHQHMDWYSWLSKSSLDPSLIYEYGLSFARNELQKDDLAYFNHEFLQSMGISVAKHRLEILKLAKKEVGSTPKSLSKLILAIAKTKKRFNKYVNRLVHHEASSSSEIKALPEPESTARYKESRKGGFARKCKSEKELKIEQPIPRFTRKIAKSGPLDMRAQEKLMNNTRSLKLSGPLDRKMNDRLVFSYKSPILSGPVEFNKSPKLSGPISGRPLSPRFYGEYSGEKLGYGGEYGDQSLWAALFQDLKPT